MLAEWLKEGAKIRLLESGKPIDELVVCELHMGKIEVESQQSFPGVKTEFLYVPREGGWKVVTEGLGGERGYSQLAPTYTFEPIETT